MNDFDDIYGRNFSSRSSLNGGKHTGTSKTRTRSSGKGKRRAKKNSLASLLDIKNFKQNITQMNKYQKRRLGAILIVIAIIILIIIIANLGNTHKVPEVTTFLLNNSLVSPKNEMFYDEDEEVAYLSYDDIYSIFDDNMYYNNVENYLITTYNTHIAKLSLNEKTMNLNDSEIKLKGKLQNKDGKLYLPFTDLGIVYDLEVEFSKDYNRIIASSIKDEKKRSITLKACDLKENPSIFAKTIEKLPMSHYVIILEDAGNYQKVRSENGNIGYVSNGKIGRIDVFRTKMIEEEVKYNIIDEDNIIKNYDDGLLRQDAINVAIPDLFVLNDENTVSNKISTSSNAYQEFEEWCKDKEVQIWAILTSNVDVSSDLSSYDSRNSTIQELYNKVMTNELQGILIDFEEIDDINSFIRFIIEITPRFKESGLKVGVRLPDGISSENSTKINSIVDTSI